MTEFLEVGKRVGFVIVCFCIVVNPAESPWWRGLAGIALSLEAVLVILWALTAPK